MWLSGGETITHRRPRPRSRTLIAVDDRQRQRENRRTLCPRRSTLRWPRPVKFSIGLSLRILGSRRPVHGQWAVTSAPGFANAYCGASAAEIAPNPLSGRLAGLNVLTRSVLQRSRVGVLGRHIFASGGAASTRTEHFVDGQVRPVGSCWH